MKKFLVQFYLGSDAMFKCDMRAENRESLANFLAQQTYIEIPPPDHDFSARLSVIMMSHVKYFDISEKDNKQIR